ncbi:hypothetical protein EST62_13150 [Chlorobaculum sp. 24CR]|uniref:AbiU2 domain-containing protein n=1 Tax=Chlorobaculum sp. 24CR TaxID=2508878 RepID=UPI00100B5DC1|nr:hypothetical protein [Chlorobaculum sp. 24CR]RXK80045.1 hypothetical protein EST62_13150 [Chlorobaculum sp. 24CR]
MSSNPKANEDKTRLDEIVTQFSGAVHELKIYHYTLKQLVDAEEDRMLLQRAAGRFFELIRDVLVNYLNLEFSKLLGPPKSCGVENFSVENILNDAEFGWSELLKQSVNEELSRIPLSFCDRKNGAIYTARNKYFAHYDKEVFLAKGVIGEFPEGDDEKALTALENISNLFYEARFGEIRGDMVLTGAGDVHDLKKYLCRGLAFKKLFHERGADVQRLYELRKEQCPHL